MAENVPYADKDYFTWDALLKTAAAEGKDDMHYLLWEMLLT